MSLRAGARCFAYEREREQSLGLPATSESSELNLDEELLVLDWRTEQFRMFGFGCVHAQLLAECGDVDLGRLRRLIAGGCDLVDWAGASIPGPIGFILSTLASL